MRSLGDGGLDLPFEGQDRTDLTGEFLPSGGVVVMAAVVPVGGNDEPNDEPALVFRFARPDGEFYPPILLVTSDEQLTAIIPLVAKAVEAATTQARQAM